MSGGICPGGTCLGVYVLAPINYSYIHKPIICMTCKLTFGHGNLTLGKDIILHYER